MDALLATLRHAIPGFCERALTYDDFLAACKREGITVEERPYLYDEYLSRRGRRPRITLNVGLAPLYKTFVAFHALGHWFCHPGNQEFYLGSPGWLHRIELEASTVGFLAIAPWPNGPPYPQLARAHTEGDEMKFWVRFPPALRTDGTLSARTRRMVIRRHVDQLELFE